MSNKKRSVNKKKDILILLTQDLESPSGLGRYYPMAKQLVKAGYPTTIIAPHSNFPFLTQYELFQDGINIRYVAQMHVKKEGNKTIYFKPIKLIWLTIASTWKLFWSAVKHKYDIILIGKPHPMNGVAGLIAGRLRGSKVIVDCDDYEAESNRFGSPFQKSIVRFFEDTIPKRADLITTNTFFTKERLISLGINSKKIKYVPNGIDPDRFAEPDPQLVAQMTQRYSLEDYKVIAYIGSLNLANHSVDLLLEAFHLISQDIPTTRLLIVGGGGDEETLRKQAQSLGITDRVIFTGRISPDMVPVFYRLANVTVDPVHDTAAARGRCPLKMFESWAMGVPFVTSDVGDRSALAGAPKAALLCTPGSPTSLANHILLLIHHIDIARDIIEQGKSNLGEYSWHRLSECFLSILENEDNHK